MHASQQIQSLISSKSIKIKLFNKKSRLNNKLVASSQKLSKRFNEIGKFNGPVELFSLVPFPSCRNVHALRLGMVLTSGRGKR